MRGEEPIERVDGDILAAAQDLQQPVAQQRHRGHDIGADRRGEVSQLVPRQQIAGETEAEREQKQEITGNPGHFARRAIRLQHHRAEHVEHQRNDHQVRAPTVDRTDQPAERNLGRQKTNALVGGRFTRLIVHEQEHAGNHLDDEKEHRDPAEVIPTHPVRAQRHLLVTQKFEERRQLITPIEPAAQPSALCGAVCMSGFFFRDDDSTVRLSIGCVLRQRLRRRPGQARAR